MVSFQSLALLSLQRTSVLVTAAAALLLQEDEHANAIDSMSDNNLLDMLSISIDDLVGNGQKRLLQQDGTAVKTRMVKYDHERTYQCILDDYLSEQSKFNDHQFDWHFHITRGRLEFILVQELAKDDPFCFWTNSIDCCGRVGNRPETKMLAALKTICYGVSFSTFQSYFQMGESTVHMCVSKFC